MRRHVRLAALLSFNAFGGCIPEIQVARGCPDGLSCDAGSYGVSEVVASSDERRRTPPSAPPPPRGDDDACD